MKKELSTRQTSEMARERQQVLASLSNMTESISKAILWAVGGERGI